MALADWYADNGRDVVLEAITSPHERQRKLEAQRRVELLNDDYNTALEDYFNRLFRTKEVRDSMLPFIPLACANSLLKRISHEIARPVYAQTPRRVVTDSSRESFQAIAKAVGWDLICDTIARMIVPCNDLFVLVRYIKAPPPTKGAPSPKDYGWSFDIITAGQMTVIPHPRKADAALAYAYERVDSVPGGKANRIVVWDDRMTYTINEDGGRYVTGEEPEDHGWPRAPIVEVHQTARLGTFFERKRGLDLVAGSLAAAYITALVLKLHYQQGEKLVGVIGDMPHDQTLDGGGIIQFEAGSQVVPIDYVTDPGHYLKTKAEIETTLSANYGVSRARLNQQKDGADSDDAALLERTAEIMRIMRGVEQDLFAAVQMVSDEAPPAMRIAADATMALDYGEFAERTDRKAQLEILELERSMGISNVLQDIMRRNPELTDEADAWEYFQHNLEVEVERVKRMRALNMAPDASPSMPGQNPQQQGALGPAVRDGLLSKQDAAALAATGDTSITTT